MVEHNFTEAEQHHRHSYAHYRGSSKVHMQASKQASKHKISRKCPCAMGFFTLFI